MSLISHKFESNKFEPLTEFERLAYLDAMDIPVWVLRDLPANADYLEIEIESNESVESELIETDIEKAEFEKPELEESELEESIIDREVELPIKPTITNKISSEKQLTNKCFLKMVNWKSKETADKSLLIICRHQIDQPAQSFAKTNAPSQFMMDYIQTLDELLKNESFSLQVQLAHLTEAGLGNDNFPLEKTLNDIKPNLILLLGDDSIKLLMNAEEDVAQFRGKIQDLNFINQLTVNQVELLANNNNSNHRPKTLVSYHPYTLIENPALKKLAFEDLSLLIKILKDTH